MVASGCYIKNLKAEKCAEVADSAGQPLYLDTCDYSDVQTFNFFTATKY